MHHHIHSLSTAIRRMMVPLRTLRGVAIGVIIVVLIISGHSPG
ncbi:hypothetical protein Psta_3257 [Pirellula staleyi DSM 6068]|uniref:Uncharacterized protein n=1 Tax=Pirellula staleyi (strain ATCC 27377 / DSM 6068 / ICPB 4128) TaxID=530564 RepID=D2QX81_PIRSD|nr:hypothetical protein Psta_3257 [Pirellula staleyi DSM 6068]